MESFKAANPGCVLADFVRWHSPRDWDQGGFQLLDLIITELKSHMTCLKIQCLSLVEILFVKTYFTRFALQSECCNFNQ